MKEITKYNTIDYLTCNVNVFEMLTYNNPKMLCCTGELHDIYDVFFINYISETIVQESQLLE